MYRKYIKQIKHLYFELFQIQVNLISNFFEFGFFLDLI